MTTLPNVLPQQKTASIKQKGRSFYAAAFDEKDLIS